MQSGLPLDKEYRRLKLSAQITAKIVAHIQARGLGPYDLLFSYQAPDRTAARRRLGVIETAGLTDPDASGRRYRHGTLTAYNAARCRCEHCRGAYASYRAARRAAGKDSPREPRVRETDGHIPADCFRRQVWYPARDGPGSPGSPGCGCMTCVTRTRPGSWPVGRTCRWSRNASATPASSPRSGTCTACPRPTRPHWMRCPGSAARSSPCPPELSGLRPRS